MLVEVREPQNWQHFGPRARAANTPAISFLGEGVAAVVSSLINLQGLQGAQSSSREGPKSRDFAGFRGLSPLNLSCKFIILNYNFPTANS